MVPWYTGSYTTVDTHLVTTRLSNVGPPYTEILSSTTICPLGTTTLTSPENVGNVFRTATAVTTGLTHTAYAACKADNVATALPYGDGYITPALFVKESALKYYPASDSIGVTATPEECCDYCFSQLICYGSVWQISASPSPNGTCVACIAIISDPASVCNITGNAITIYPDNASPTKPYAVTYAVS